MPPYRVTYIVTRTETYEVEAASVQAAEDKASDEGNDVELGEATRVDHFETEEVEA